MITRTSRTQETNLQTSVGLGVWLVTSTCKMICGKISSKAMLFGENILQDETG